MKKVLKILVMIFLSLVLLYTLFIVEESIRLSHNSIAEPLIVFNETYTGKVGDVTYESLGFTLITKYVNHPDTSDLAYPYSQEFWLFDRFLIWAWIN